MIPIVDSKARNGEPQIFILQSEISNSSNRGPVGMLGLGLDRRLINQHDGDVVFYRIDPVALGTFQAFRVLAVFKRLLASRTNEHFQKVFGNHDVCIVRQVWRGTCDRNHARKNRATVGRIVYSLIADF